MLKPMQMKLFSAVFASIAFTTLAAGPAGDHPDAFGPNYQAQQPPTAASPRHGPRQGLDSVRRWNQIAIDASGLDHTPTLREQLGPGRASRAMAIVHIAMFDALNAVVGEYESYTGVRARPGAISLQAAISQAAHDTLAALFPSQTVTFATRLAEDLSEINNRIAKANGIELGRRAASGILALRAHDHSDIPEPLMGI